MATKALISIDDYLKMSFDGPAPEYADGELAERGPGRFVYRLGRVRVSLGAGLDRMLRERGFSAAMGVSLQTGESRVRIADMAVFAPGFPAEEIPSTPPFAVAEIVFRDDRYLDILTKLGE